MFSFAQIGITAGYHRYFSHRAFNTNKLMEIFYLLAAAATFEGSVFWWAADHRNHHRFVDRDGDPYSIKKGFWWAHIGWVFYREPGDYCLNHPRFNNVADLKKNKLCILQHKYYIPIAIFMSFVLPMLIGALYGRPIGGLLFGGLLRQIATHHSTFFINSLCHLWGKQPYSKDNTAKDNFILAILTFGEGYHNYHHVFPSDYRNGIKWYHWDPTKWFIKTTEIFKLSWGLRKTPKANIEKAIAQVKNLTNKTVQWS